MLFIDHLLPATTIVFEWHHNSMRVTTHRMWLYLTFSILYATWLVYASMFQYPDGQLYYALNFKTNPLIASCLLALIVTAVPLILTVWTKLTNRKLLAT